MSCGLRSRFQCMAMQQRHGLRHNCHVWVGDKLVWLMPSSTTPCPTLAEFIDRAGAPRRSKGVPTQRRGCDAHSLC